MKALDTFETLAYQHHDELVGGAYLLTEEGWTEEEVFNIQLGRGAELIDAGRTPQEAVELLAIGIRKNVEDMTGREFKAFLTEERIRRMTPEDWRVIVYQSIGTIVRLDEERAKSGVDPFNTYGRWMERIWTTFRDKEEISEEEIDALSDEIDQLPKEIRVSMRDILYGTIYDTENQ